MEMERECVIGKKFRATIATVKCPSDHNNCANSYNAAKKGSYSVWKNIVHREVAFGATRFGISSVLFKEKNRSLISIEMLNREGVLTATSQLSHGHKGV